MNKLLLLIIIISLSAGFRARGQTYSGDEQLDEIEVKLQTLVYTDPAYGEEVDVAIGKLPLSEMLKNIAKVSKVSLSVRDAENIVVTCNFSRAKISDLLYFFCKEYNLDLDIVGNIVSVRPVMQPAPEPKIPDIKYEARDTLMSYDLTDDRLIDVAKRITALSGVNFIVPQQLHSTLVSGFAEKMKFVDALEALGTVNNLDIARNTDKIWEVTAAGADPNAMMAQGQSFRRRSIGANQLQIDSLGFITARINRGNVSDIISEVCERQGFNYFFVSPVSHQVSLYVNEITFETLLNVLLMGSQYTWYYENDIYILGGVSKGGAMFTTRVIPLDNRSVANLDEFMPDNLKDGLQIKRFVDLNSIVASGDQRAVARVEAFLRSVDKRVPQVTIEVMIVDATKSKINEAGINMGLGNSPSKTTGTLFPFDFSFSSGSINSLINSFNGFGSVNLGKVSSDFYMSLKFLEENGFIEMKSTPKLSAFNGHEANLKSGQTQYYKEITNTWMGSGSSNPVSSENYVWRSVDANLMVKIVPHISTDNHITLDIEIEQTEFLARVSEEGPPGTATRSFKSVIRVQNEEMVLLGGIDRNSREKSSKGLPLLARIPVLKWLFGSTKDNKEDHLLNIFIKPTIID